MSESVEHCIKTCPVGCGAGFEVSGIVLPEGPLRRCTACGQLVSQCSERLFRDSMGEFDDPRGTIPSEKSDITRLLGRVEKILSRVEAILGKSRKEIHLLDVGCSSGAFMSVAKNMGVSVEGVEPAPGPAGTALESGLKVHQGFLEDMSLQEGSADVITVFEVIEHLKDPVGLSLECFRILRPGGIMVIRTGNGDSWTSHYMKGRWEYFHIVKHGGHISFFNPVSIRRLAERSGFVVERISSYGVRFYEKGDVPWILYRGAKFVSEILNMPSTCFGKGHELLVYMKKPS